MTDRSAESRRPRARDLGLIVGILPPGARDAITDVAGVRVGHATVIRGDRIRTGVTAILPHAANVFQEKVPAAVFVGNGFGKLIGSTQIDELGEIETPILLTNTLAVGRVADALVDWTLAQAGNEKVRSVNPVVGETNDGFLNDIRARGVTSDDVAEALRAARDGPVEEGSVGAGTGTVAFGWKGGIGTASRVIPSGLAASGFTVGVLVQSNFGGVLSICGAPVGQALGRFYLSERVKSAAPATAQSSSPSTAPANDPADGSIMIVIATDAPLDARNLKRLAFRSMFGLARAGASGSNGSGDYAIAFSTATRIRAGAGGEPPRTTQTLSNDACSPLFHAVIEATEEAIYNSLFMATTVVGRDGNRAEALPLDVTLDILRRHAVIQ
jgi:D-aminopeptidase